MLTVYLTDLERTVDCDIYQGKAATPFVMALKKVFFSTEDLLEPVIPDDQDINKITWKSTEQDLSTFSRLARSWQQIELRLRAYAVFAGRDAMDVVVQVAREKRKATYDELGSFEVSRLELDILLMYSIHQQLDNLLSREKPYSPDFLKGWAEFQPAKFIK